MGIKDIRSVTLVTEVIKMNKESKKNFQEEVPKSIQESSSWKSVWSQRWVYPAAYMAAAGIILTLVWAYQGSTQKTFTADQSQQTVPTSASTPETDEEATAVEATIKAENFIWPVQDPAEIAIVRPFYDVEGSAEQHEMAMAQYADTFMPNAGIDIARNDQKTFEVRAALSGTVSKVEQHPVMGHVVEITDNEKRKTVYQSLSDVKVKKDEVVSQGDIIASAGTNEMSKNLGNHLHFEVYQDEKPVNPQQVLPEK